MSGGGAKSCPALPASALPAPVQPVPARPTPARPHTSPPPGRFSQSPHFQHNTQSGWFDFAPATSRNNKSINHLQKTPGHDDVMPDLIGHLTTTPSPPLTTPSPPRFRNYLSSNQLHFCSGGFFPKQNRNTLALNHLQKRGAGWLGIVGDAWGGDRGGDRGGDGGGDKDGDKGGDGGGSGAGDGAEAPPPDIASGGYELRAAFELWELDAASLVAGPKRPSAKYTIFAPGRHGVGAGRQIGNEAGGELGLARLRPKSSSKWGVFEDEMGKNGVSSSNKACFEDEK